MTVNTENKQETSLSQDKIDVNLPQQNLEATQEVKPEESKEDPNWRVVREKLKKEKEHREIAEKRAAEKEAEANALKEAMEAAFSKIPSPNQQQQQQYGYQQEESEDQKIERMVSEKVSKFEQDFEKKMFEREHKQYPAKLAQIYPDFHQMTSDENLAYLDYHYPEVSSPLKRLKDDFDKWSDIYKAVKKFVPNANNARREAAKAESNLMKPKSMSSTGVTQTGETGSKRMSEEQRASNWERMQRVIKGI